jgi:hypothetical protein
METRLPTILGKAIDDAVKTLNEQSEEEIVTDLLECIGPLTSPRGRLALLTSCHQSVWSCSWLI